MKRVPSPLLPVLVFALGCGGAQSGPTLELTPETYFPLAEGNVWTYDVDTGDGGPPTLAITRVVAAELGRYSVSNNGSDPIAYEHTPEGVRRALDGIYILKWPLRVGASWEGPGGRQSVIVATEGSEETPSGTFSHCVSVEERGDRAAREIRTTYCPGVGMVALDTSMQTMHELVVVRARLRAFDLVSADAPAE